VRFVITSWLERRFVDPDEIPSADLERLVQVGALATAPSDRSPPLRRV
jgi:hypothetical protein